MKYTAINIGPIIGTLGLARKPKELWAASYMFSFLMGMIVDKLKHNGFAIISPAEGKTTEGVGLYPDRAFIKNPDDKDITKLLDETIQEFSKKTGVGKDYVNIMHASIEENNEMNVLKKLNQILDCAELVNRPPTDGSLNSVRKRIENPAVLGNRGIPDLEKIANSMLMPQDDHSYRHYICVVQADGDNMGQRINGLSLSEVGELSKKLLQTGNEACRKIKDYGGEPIYAGGDDLLFLAPVVSSDEACDNIFKLLYAIDALYKGLDTSMSFGLSISYYKYPLYESLKDARKSLFDTAKGIGGKHAIAWCLRKHSGSGFEGVFSINNTNDVLKHFNELMAMSDKGVQVSAIAHKLRANVDLLDIIRKDTDNREERIAALYKKMMEEGNSKNDKYVERTRDLLCALLKTYEKKNTDDILETMYGMLRTSKFINGEGDDDE